MRISLARSLGITSLLLLAAALGACGNVSHKVAADGGSAGQLVWPSPDSATPMHKDGTFPSVADLRLIKAGMNKQQVMQLVGPPHFSEGVWGVREWNYLFNFRKPGSADVVQCQYKILFDERKLARSFYWKPESCAAKLDEPEKAAAAVTGVQRFTLLSDVLFAFDKSDEASIRPAGAAQLARLADKIKTRGDDVNRVRVVGYTDRLGSEDYNQQLSERRARTVMQVLRENGVAADRIEALGRGEDDPVKSCDEKSRVKLIACLAPNRRVEVVVEGKQGR